MEEEPYHFQLTSRQTVRYQFDSISETEVVKKIVEFVLIDKGLSLYNLSLLDALEDGVSDVSISNNKDMPKVLATVYQTILHFFTSSPHALVIFQGSSASRTRLYRIAIAKTKSDIDHKIRILGLINGEFEDFQEDRNYGSFLFQPVINE